MNARFSKRPAVAGIALLGALLAFTSCDQRESRQPVTAPNVLIAPEGAIEPEAEDPNLHTAGSITFFDQTSYDRSIGEDYVNALLVTWFAPDYHATPDYHFKRRLQAQANEGTIIHDLAAGKGHTVKFAVTSGTSVTVARIDTTASSAVAEVTPIAVGDSKVTLTVDGKYTKVWTIKVKAQPTYTLEIQPNPISLTPGQSVGLKALLKPTGGTPRYVTASYSVGDPAIASASGSTLVGKAVGTTTLTAYHTVVEPGWTTPVSSTAQVTVGVAYVLRPSAPTLIIWDSVAMRMFRFTTPTDSVEVTPLTLTSSNPFYAYVNGNRVYGIAVGTVTISASGTFNGEAASASTVVTVIQPTPIGGIQMADSVTVRQGKQIEVYPAYFRKDGSCCVPKPEVDSVWTSSDPSVAKHIGVLDVSGAFSREFIAGYKRGTATVTVTAGGLSRSMFVRVYDDTVTEVRIKQRIVDAYVGQSGYLTAVGYSNGVLLDSSSQNKVTWSSGNPAIISVTNYQGGWINQAGGQWSALNEGTTYIRATTATGLFDQIPVHLMYAELTFVEIENGSAPALRNCGHTAIFSGGVGPYAYKWSVNGGWYKWETQQQFFYQNDGNDYTLGVVITDSRGATATGSRLIDVYDGGAKAPCGPI